MLACLLAHDVPGCLCLLKNAKTRLHAEDRQTYCQQIESSLILIPKGTNSKTKYNETCSCGTWIQNSKLKTSEGIGPTAHNNLLH
jgi:hypothetical protein